MTIWRCKQKNYIKTDIWYKLNHGKEQKFLKSSPSFILKIKRWWRWLLENKILTRETNGRILKIITTLKGIIAMIIIIIVTLYSYEIHSGFIYLKKNQLGLRLQILTLLCVVSDLAELHHHHLMTESLDSYHLPAQHGHKTTVWGLSNPERCK